MRTSASTPMSNREKLKRSSGSQKETAVGVGDPLSLNVMKMLRRNKANSESGSSNGGSNSEDSALVSLGNTSFGFNFDSEEGMSNSSPPDESEQNSEEDVEDSKPPATSKAQGSKPPPTGRQPLLKPPSSFPLTASSLSNLASISGVKSTTATATAGGGNSRRPQVTESTSSSAPSVSTSANNPCTGSSGFRREHTNPVSIQQLRQQQQQQQQQLQLHLHLQRKRKSSDNESGGYNTDDDEEADEKASSYDNPGPMMIGSSATASGSSSIDHSEDRPSKKKKLNDKKREERNAREKERSLRISQQINELRGLLSNGGVVVPKGTKSSVLTEAANYIRMLQQHQYRSEIDRQQLVQQMQMIGSGAHGAQAAATIRHVAAQNGVWSLGNFGGVPPKSAMTFYQPNASEDTTSSTDSADQNDTAAALGALKIEAPDYRFVFNSCGFAMAIASMGGAFLDCNHLFSQLSQYTKQELCSQTIFNLTARQDLQRAFDEISQLISSPASETDPKPVVLKCSLKNRGDLGLSVSLVRGEDGIAKCFCVALIKTQLDMGRPVPVSFDTLEALPTGASQPMAKDGGMDASPAFTSG